MEPSSGPIYVQRCKDGVWRESPGLPNDEIRPDDGWQTDLQTEQGHVAERGPDRSPWLTMIYVEEGGGGGWVAAEDWKQAG